MLGFGERDGRDSVERGTEKGFEEEDVGQEDQVLGGTLTGEAKSVGWCP